MSKLQAAGVSSELAKSTNFKSAETIDIKSACKYAAENGYDVAITGIVTEWIDGATQWSGRVDVAALTVSVYTTDDCHFARSASGRQKGQWITFVNAPTTRFFEPLSQEIVSALVQ